VTQAALSQGRPEVAAGRSRPGGGRRLVSLFRTAVIQRRGAAIFAVAVVLFIYFTIASSNFLSVADMQNLSQFVAPVAVIGAGEVFLLVCAEVDLSAGTVFVFMPFVVYYLDKSFGLPLLLSIVLAVAVGALIGATNGIVTTKLRVPSFVTTLGMLFLLDGLMLVLSNAAELTMPGSGTLASVFGGWGWSEIIWAAVIVAILYVVLDRTRFGMHAIAAGGNLLGAAEAGVPVDRVKIWCFTLCSAVSALIGIIDTIRVTVLDPGNTGETEMFYAISAAVIGGTALTGGSGTVVGGFVGAVVLGVLYVGLTIVGISANAFILILGLAILGAMAANVQISRLSERRKATS
jgi:simple sugar transport system permease protein